MTVRGESPPQMKLVLFSKDIPLRQEAAEAVGAPLPFTDLAERLYAAAQAAGHGSEDLAVVVRALEAAREKLPMRCGKNHPLDSWIRELPGAVPGPMYQCRLLLWLTETR